MTNFSIYIILFGAILFFLSALLFRSQKPLKVGGSLITKPLLFVGMLAGVVLIALPLWLLA